MHRVIMMRRRRPPVPPIGGIESSILPEYWVCTVSTILICLEQRSACMHLRTRSTSPNGLVITQAHAGPVGRYWDVRAMSSRGVCVSAASASDEKQCSCARSAQTNPLMRRVARRRSATYFMIEPHSNEMIECGTLWRFSGVSR